LLGHAPTESLWGSLKRARILGQRFATRREAMDEVIDWLSFYNHSRVHSTLGYVSQMLDVLLEPRLCVHRLSQSTSTPSTFQLGEECLLVGTRSNL
jgi:hypothetical protein